MPEVVIADRAGDLREMPSDQPVKNKDDEDGDKKSLGALAHQNDESVLHQAAIDPGKAGLDHEAADGLRSIRRLVDDRHVAPERAAVVLDAGGHPQRRRGVADLGYFGIAEIGQAGDAVELQLKLLLVELPETFRQAVEIAVLDLGETPFDRTHVEAVVEIELHRGQDQGHRGAEQQHEAQQAGCDAATQLSKPRDARRRGIPWLGQWRRR